jgi:hypothetical protein
VLYVGRGPPSVEMTGSETGMTNSANSATSASVGTMNQPDMSKAPEALMGKEHVPMEQGTGLIHHAFGPEDPARTYRTTLYPVGEPDRPVTNPVMSLDPPTGGNPVMVIRGAERGEGVREGVRVFDTFVDEGVAVGVRLEVREGVAAGDARKPAGTIVEAGSELYVGRARPSTEITVSPTGIISIANDATMASVGTINQPLISKVPLALRGKEHVPSEHGTGLIHHALGPELPANT